MTDIVKEDIVRKLTEVWPLLNDGERINLLAACHCLGCRKYDGCGIANTNIEILMAKMERPSGDGAS